MKDLWTDGVSNFKGNHFTMDDCKLLPKPSTEIKIIGAGQSGPGMYRILSLFSDSQFKSLQCERPTDKSIQARHSLPSIAITTSPAPPESMNHSLSKRQTRD
jgi:hypothetical protein